MASVLDSTMIAWKGDVSDFVYVVPTADVPTFMAKFNDHGKWQIVENHRCRTLDMS